MRTLHVTRSALAAMLCMLAGCGDDSGGGGGGGPVSATPAPSPTPTPTAAKGPYGALYVGTNGTGSGGNQIVGFRIDNPTGAVPLGNFATGGTGRRVAPAGAPSLNALSAEDSVITIEEGPAVFVAAVNAGTNDVSLFYVNSDYTLTLMDRKPSGGTMPVSLAYSRGKLYVANADADGTFTGPPDQSGNITVMNVDVSVGRLQPVSGFAGSLGGRPADLEVTADGKLLLVSILNAGSPRLPTAEAKEVMSYAIDPAGLPASAPSGTGMSTLPGNAAGRNLPNAIGIETYTIGGRSFVIAAEARTASSTGVPAASFRDVQTGSVSIWEIGATGALTPTTTDLMLGSTTSSGPLQAAFVAVEPGYGLAYVASPPSATMTGLSIDGTGKAVLAGSGYKGDAGVGLDPANFALRPDSDGFMDVIYGPGGRFYQLLGLTGMVKAYDVVFSLEQHLTFSSSALAGGSQGMTAVGPIPARPM